MRVTRENSGTVRLAAVTNMRQVWRTMAVSSSSGPTMKPGVSQKLTMGTLKASHSCMKRDALSAPAASMAPPSTFGSLAIRPRGRPSTRTKAVIMPGAKSGRSSTTESVSANTLIRWRMS